MLQRSKMQLLTWNENYSVYIESMDRQHQKIIDIINQLHQALENYRLEDVIDQILQSLKEYTEYHFNDEEKLMAANNYPNLEQHRKTHQFLRNEITRYRQLQAKGKLTIEDLSRLLTNWLINHIMIDDKDYGRMIRDAGKSFCNTSC